MRPVDANMLERSRVFLDRHKARKLSGRTKFRYEQTGQIFFGRHKKILDTKSTRTYWLRKAALEYYAEMVLFEAGSKKDLRRFRLAFLTLEKLYTPLVGAQATGSGVQCPLAIRARKKTKRSSLRNLPNDWRDQMLCGLVGAHRDWLLLLSIVGLRPDEIASGVDIEPYLEGIKISIKGSKVGDGKGQPLRVITSFGGWESELALGGARTITASSANAVSKFVGRHAQKIFPRTKDRVSAYTYRHQVAADLKASKLSGVAVSAILGHAVDLTKKHYGNYRQSRRNVDMHLISSTNIVKVKDRSKTFSSKRTNAAGSAFSI